MFILIRGAAHTYVLLFFFFGVVRLHDLQDSLNWDGLVARLQVQKRNRASTTTYRVSRLYERC